MALRESGSSFFMLLLQRLKLKLNGNGSGATSGSVVLAVGSWLWRFVAFGFRKNVSFMYDEK